MKDEYRRLYLLFGCCCCMFGYAVNRYLLVPIQDQLIEFYDIDDVDYNLLQSLYSWPCSITCIAAGILIDKIGVNKMIFISFILTYIGMMITAISATKNIIDSSFIILCIARVIVGMSNESMRISLKVFIIRQFKINKTGQIIGILLGSSQISSAINAILTYQIYVMFDSNIQIAVSWPLLMYPIMIIPLFSYLIINICKKKQTINIDIDIKLTDLNYTQETEKTQLMETNHSVHKKEFKMSHIRLFPPMYWLIVCIGCLLTANYQTFNNIIVSFLHHTYSYSYTVSTNLASIGSIVSIFALIGCGWITDKYGRKCKLLLISMINMFVAYCMFQFISNIHLGITIIAITLFYTFAASTTTIFFSSIPIILKGINHNNKDIDFIGTGYGVYTSIVYTTIAIGYIIIGILTKSKNDQQKYRNVVFFQMIICFVSILLILILWCLDKKNGNKLNLPVMIK